MIKKYIIKRCNDTYLLQHARFLIKPQHPLPVDPQGCEVAENYPYNV